RFSDVEHAETERPVDKRPDLRIATEFLASAEVDVIGGKVGGPGSRRGSTIRVQPQLRVLPQICQLQRRAASGEEIQHDSVTERVVNLQVAYVEIVRPSPYIGRQWDDLE